MEMRNPEVLEVLFDDISDSCDSFVPYHFTGCKVSLLTVFFMIPLAMPFLVQKFGWVLRSAPCRRKLPGMTATGDAKMQRS